MELGQSPTTWGRNSASASAGGVTVTATAHVTKVVWAMGDGQTVICTGRGTPYRASYGMSTSPDCGHLFTHTSAQQPRHAYTVTATSTWTVDWQGAGQNGQLTTTRNSQVQIPVGEVQVVG
ncbi:ATP/GTP-binding protein [Streptomyces luteireticuli]|uniref:ATP/GTP-binding protein n=1 Tax=Streptomyces luteireticuli TaxID=173858 RepID=UPI0035569D5E